jgi:hypothetical protein
MKSSMVYVDLRNVRRHYVRTHFVKLLLICLPVSLKFSGKLTSQGSPGHRRGMSGVPWDENA